jgi:hypothetical protein
MNLLFKPSMGYVERTSLKKKKKKAKDIDVLRGEK